MTTIATLWTLLVSTPLGILVLCLGAAIIVFSFTWFGLELSGLRDSDPLALGGTMPKPYPSAEIAEFFLCWADEVLAEALDGALDVEWGHNSSLSPQATAEVLNQYDSAREAHLVVEDLVLVLVNKRALAAI